MNVFYKIEMWWDGLMRRRRLSLLNTRDNREVWYTHISPMSIIMALVATIILLFVLVLTLVGYTPILEVLPGYSTDVNRLRQSTTESIIRLDSMEQVITEMMLYTDNVSLIMNGKSPIVRANNLNKTTLLSKEIVQPNSADSTLRDQMEGAGRYNLQAATTLSTSPLVTPIDGVVTQQFNLGAESYGVKVATTAEQRIMAAQNGVVSMVLWSPEIGYTIQIIDNNNLLSIYYNIPVCSVSRGDVVKSGEVIGYSGSAESSREIGFELWQYGEPIDPERYIIF